MRTKQFIFSVVGATLISTGVAYGQAGFYDPSNGQSASGNTSGHELYRTIGCPGRGLLDKPCDVPPPPKVAQPAPPPAPEPPQTPVAQPAPPPKKLVLQGVHFDFDKAVIRQADVSSLDQDAAALKEWGNVKVEVAGHTDSMGPDAYNMGLSQRRAEAVRNYLISKGIAADSLTAKGYGESQPVADNQTAEGRLQNRRVELLPQQ